ncbi:S9 family peptidase [Pseudolysobacter antarcticus]|uniref:S9 family peptidase n=1 Tax=Pseudolysobacter antarcticus TaxID=2511995 RepID=A0A411HHK0_9GAMM|nr:prolyl oligopeptidase family serine peptidase [Pseudolysobacter antarcticus]QBB69867.1 S9 family peptidase [Pseudolysobacter antarcticus]
MQFGKFFLAGASLVLGFCSVAWGKEYKPGESVDLKPGNGLLAVDIDITGFASSVKIDRVGSLFGGELFTKLHGGDNVLLVEMPAGDYRWSRIELAPLNMYLRVRDDPRFHIKINPGVVNYVGDLQVAPSGIGSGFNINTVNRAARMLVSLDRFYPGLWRKFSMRYEGGLPDRFPQFAAHELGEQTALDAVTAGISGDAKTAPKDVAPELHPLVNELFAQRQLRVVRLNPRGDLIAMIEYREGKHRVSVLDVQSNFAVDVYRGDIEVRSIAFAGDRTVLFGLNLPEGNNNHVVHLEAKPGAAPGFTQFVIPGRGVIIDPMPNDGAHAIYAYTNVDWETHIFRIDLGGKRFDMGQLRSELRLDKGLNKAYYGLADVAGNLRLAMVMIDGDYALMYRADLKTPWQEVYRHTADETFEPILLSSDGNSLVALANKDRAQTDLVRIALPSGVVSETMFSIPGTDVDAAITRLADRRVLAVNVYHDGALQTRYLDEPDDAIRGSLAQVLPRKNVAIYDSSADKSRVLVLASDEIDPGTFYLYDSVAKKLQQLLSVQPPMPDVRAARSQLIKVTVADNTTIESYLTLPVQSKPPYPLVVMPHGGPFGARDAIEFDPEVQLMANRGYAVLRVNYRGSGGFGSAFEHAGFGAWGKTIEDDVLAALDVVVKNEVIDKSRIALRGTSYGGYSALMGLIRSPDRFRCGVAISAVTDLPLMFSSSDWSQDKKVREKMQRIVGDPTKAQADMEAVSPDYLYRKLERPLLIVHGALDRRVTSEHALRLLMLLGHAKMTPQSLFLVNEGHGVRDLDARYLTEASIEHFFTTCLASAQPVAAKSGVSQQK